MGISVTGGVKVPQGKFSVTVSPVATAANFDGVDDRLFHTGALSTITNEKTGLISLWFKPGASSFSGRIVHISDAIETFSAKFDVALSSNEFAVVGRPTGSATPVLNIRSVSAFPTADVWVHAMASWDLGAGPITQMYINSASDLSVTTETDDTINYSFGDTAIAAQAYPETARWNGCLAELYFTNEFLDLDVPSNRAKFISGGLPVDLGANGSTPTGTQPILYFSGDASAFPTNLGSGGAFTVENGPLTDCADGPSV